MTRDPFNKTPWLLNMKKQPIIYNKYVIVKYNIISYDISHKVISIVSMALNHSPFKSFLLLLIYIGGFASGTLMPDSRLLSVAISLFGLL